MFVRNSVETWHFDRADSTSKFQREANCTGQTCFFGNIVDSFRHIFISPLISVKCANSILFCDDFTTISTKEQLIKDTNICL